MPKQLCQNQSASEPLSKRRTFDRAPSLAGTPMTRWTWGRVTPSCAILAAGARRPEAVLASAAGRVCFPGACCRSSDCLLHCFVVFARPNFACANKYSGTGSVPLLLPALDTPSGLARQQFFRGLHALLCRFDLYGSSRVEAAQIDQVVDGVEVSRHESFF